MLALGPNWHTVDWVARELHVGRRAIQKWCANGFLVECGYKVVQLHNDPGVSGKPRWWILPPIDMIKAASVRDSVHNMQQRTEQVDVPIPPIALSQREGATTRS